MFFSHDVYFFITFARGLELIYDKESIDIKHVVCVDGNLGL